MRVIGNNSLHGGQIDMRDDSTIALALFDLVNLITNVMITKPKKLVPYTTLYLRRQNRVSKNEIVNKNNSYSIHVPTENRKTVSHRGNRTQSNNHFKKVNFLIDMLEILEKTSIKFR